MPIHDPQLLLRAGPNDLVAGDPAGMPGRRVDLEAAAGQAAPERKLLGWRRAKWSQVVQRSSRGPLRKRFRWWACQDFNLGPHPYQQNVGNRCAKRRSRRSRSTVEAEVMCSRGVQLCALIVRLASFAGQHRTQPGIDDRSLSHAAVAGGQPIRPTLDSVLAHEPAGRRSQTRHATGGTCQGRIRQPLALRPAAPEGATAFCGPGGGNTKPVMARSAMTATTRR